MLRRLLPLLLFAIAGVAGWWLVWNDPSDSTPVAVEDDPEPELEAPKVQLAPERQPTPVQPAPLPTPAPTPEPKEAPVAQHDPQDDPEAEPDPRKVLDLPEHLQDKSEAEQRQYFVDLKAHHEGMMGYARERMEALLDSQDPEERAAGFRLRNDLKDAEAQLKVIEEYLEEHPE